MSKRSKLPRAVALRYDRQQEPAPRVVASGQGSVAERVIALAREHDITIYEDPDLVEVLAQLDLGSLIPEELYLPLAEILTYVYQMNDQFRSNLKGPIEE